MAAAGDRFVMPVRRDSSQTSLLKRAGWSLLNSGSQVSLKVPEPQWEAEGLRIVREVASCWSEKYIFTIRRSGASRGAYHYECLFSLPKDAEPVPGVIVAVRFALVLLDAPSTQPFRLFYSFEEADLRHEWALGKDSAGRWSATQGAQDFTLNVRAFQRYLDSYIAEKVTVRKRGINVETPFETSRLPPPPQFVLDEEEESGSRVHFDSQDAHVRWEKTSTGGEDDMEQKEADEMRAAMIKALKAANMYCDQVAPPASLTELLANIFDAADEDLVGELPHLEVTNVLNSALSGFGLEEWDIQQLLASAPENDEGYIMWKPFIQAIPEVIEALRKRREAYKERGLPGVEIRPEAVQHCFEEEVVVTVEAMLAAFNACVQEDPSRGRFDIDPNAGKTPGAMMGTSPPRTASAGDSPGFGRQVTQAAEEEMMLVALKRRWARECMETLTERLSPQEALRLMQMLPEDEDGFVQIDDLKERLEHLRTQAFLNGLVETNLSALRTHLVLNFRKVGLVGNGKLKIWQVKQALLNADQICLSRLQIHVLLCLAGADKQGDVDVSIFCGICCVVIPHMCDAKIFVETAERLELEHAEMLKERANAELAALGAARAGKKDDDEVKEVVAEVDQETVEKVLNQVFQLADTTHRNPATLAPETIWRLLVPGNDPQVETCMLSELELCGLGAEMVLEANGEVIYSHFLKRWIPIIFELRKSQLLACYLKDNAAESLGIPEPDFEGLEAIFPLLPAGMGRTDSKDSSKDSMKRAVSMRGTDSMGARRTEREGRSGSKGTLGRSRSMRGDGSMERGKDGKMVYEVEEFLVKEPPPGRGYGRRRARLEEEGLIVTKTVEARSGSKEALAMSGRMKSKSQVATPTSSKKRDMDDRDSGFARATTTFN